MSQVYIVKCADYAHVEKKLEELVAMMGGVEALVKRDERIVLKPNLLLACEPGRAATTHPAVIAATAKIVGRVARSVILAESPGSGYAYDRKSLEKTYRACGMGDAARESGMELNYDTSFETVSFPSGRLVKRFEIIRPIRSADGYINVCKLKTHGLLFLTGAVKNIFGVIPGRAKAAYHGTMTARELFSGMLLDLAAAAPPRLTVMDAVIGMEGEGPGNGIPRPIGLLIASADPLSVDIVASEIMGIPADKNPLLAEAVRRGLRPARLEDVEVIGPPLDEIRLDDFKLPSTYVEHKARLGMSLLGRVAKAFFTVDPRVRKAKCEACGACREACPRGAIEVGRTAVINRKKCIRCYCCHEMCAYDAIELHRSIPYRMANRGHGS